MRARLLLLSVIWLVTGVGAAYAQASKDADVAALQKRVLQLEQMVSRLEQKLNEMQAATGQPAPAAQAGQPAATVGKVQVEPPTVKTGRDTFSITSADGAYRLRFGGHMQEDGKVFDDGGGFYGSTSHQLIDGFQPRRVRPILEAGLGKYVDIRFMPDFGAGKSLIYDAYMDIKAKPYAVVRAGKFKTPLGLEQLQNDADLTFIERSLVTDLVPNRDEGVMLWGDYQGQVTYQLAFLNGAPVGQNIDADSNNSKDWVGRVFLTPFSKSGPAPLKALSFGVSASTGLETGSALPTFNTTGGQLSFFSYGYGSGSSAIAPTASGRRTDYSPQITYYDGPFGFMGEYAKMTQNIAAVESGKTVASEIGDYAWQMTASYVLTGEKKTFKGVIPRKALEGGKIDLGKGAWEVAARYTTLKIDQAAFDNKFADPAKSAHQAKTWSVGLNWYLNYFVKLQFNFEETDFTGGNVADATHPLFGNRPTEKAFEQRLQIAF